MLKPNIDELMEKVDSRYTLVMVVAKRARQLIEKNDCLAETDSKKPISMAVEEFYQDKLHYTPYDPNAIEEIEEVVEEAPSPGEEG